MIVKEIAGDDRVHALRALADRLREVGYGPATLREYLSVGFPDDVGLLNHAPAVERMRKLRTPVASAIRLFYLENADALAAVRRLLSRREPTALPAIGLFAARAGRLRARLRIDVYGSSYGLSVSR